MAKCLHIFNRAQTTRPTAEKLFILNALSQRVSQKLNNLQARLRRKGTLSISTMHVHKFLTLNAQDCNTLEGEQGILGTELFSCLAETAFTTLARSTTRSDPVS